MDEEEWDQGETLEEMLGGKEEYLIFQYERQLVEFLESEFVFSMLGRKK